MCRPYSFSVAWQRLTASCCTSIRMLSCHKVHRVPDTSKLPVLCMVFYTEGQLDSAVVLLAVPFFHPEASGRARLQMG